MRRSLLSGFFGFFGALAGFLIVAAIAAVITLIVDPGLFGLGGKPSPQDIAAIGAAQRVGDVEVTVNGVRESQGGLIIRPATGNKWVIVDVSARNTGRDAYGASAYFQTHLRDGEGRNYNAILVPDLKGSFDGTIPVGGTLRGEIAFEVPQSSKGLIFLYQQIIGKDLALWALQ
jgi:hypothetical protein